MRRVGRWGLFGVLLGLGGCLHPPGEGTVSSAQFHLEGRSGLRAERATEVELPVSGVTLSVDPLPVLVLEDIAKVDLAEVDLGRCLRFEFRGPAARALYRISVEHRGSRLVLFFDGLPVGARVLETVIEDGVLFTFVELPDAALPALMEGLNDALRDRS